MATKKSRPLSTKKDQLNVSGSRNRSSSKRRVGSVVGDISHDRSVTEIKHDYAVSHVDKQESLG
jgi:hypothetical protein